MNQRARLFVLIALLFPSSLWAAAPLMHHRIEVALQPERHTLRVVDKLTIPQERVSPEMLFMLNQGIQPKITGNVDTFPSASGPRSEDYTASAQEVESRAAAGFRPYVLRPLGAKGAALEMTITYEGTIHAPLQETANNYVGGHQTTPGTISDNGVFLTGASGWIPWFGHEASTFELQLTLPKGWRGLTAGVRTAARDEGGVRIETWRMEQPVDEIHLAAAPWVEYGRTVDNVELMVLLRTPEPALAERYLEASQRHIQRFSALIGPYPFGKFAVAENFWETGYAMPSFTLLGPKVIRLPFIPQTSLPHEILHNWFGNGVFTQYEGGNWNEGLTTYLADHLLAESQGKGVEHRRQLLQKFTDYVQAGQDRPLLEFRGRATGADQAAGYGRMALLTHMLRQELGDGPFIMAIRDFFATNRFQRVGFDALRQAFEKQAGHSLEPFFTQWTGRSGAPQLGLSEVVSIPAYQEGGFKLSFILEQKQEGEPFALRVPVAIHLLGQSEAQWSVVTMTTRRQQFVLPVKERPTRLEIDPEFDLFRRLSQEETPPTMGRLFGDEIGLILLPSKALKPMQRAYQRLALAWGLETKLDSEVPKLPKDRSVWLLGWENLHGPHFFAALGEREVPLYEGGVVDLDGVRLPRKGHSFAMAARHPLNPQSALGWLATDDGDTLYELTGKLPHLGRYGYSAFAGKQAETVAKGTWRVRETPLERRAMQMDRFDVGDHRATLPKRKALGE